jgi:ankyrin repeat protein
MSTESTAPPPPAGGASTDIGTDPAHKITANLMLACIRKRDTAGLQKLITRGSSSSNASVDADATPTKGGQSLVMLASSAQDINTVQMLITAGCNVNYMDKAGTSVASILSSNGSVAILQLLLDNGLDLELLSKPNYQGCTPAHFAAQMGE